MRGIVRPIARDAGNYCSPRDLDSPILAKPASPGFPDAPGEHEMLPMLEKGVDVDEPSDIFVDPFLQDLLVHEPELHRIAKVVRAAGAAPADSKRKLDDPTGFIDGRVVHVVGDRNRTSRVRRNGAGRRRCPCSPAPAVERIGNGLADSEIRRLCGRACDVIEEPSALASGKARRPRSG